MIASPINDHACLAPTTDQVVAEVAAKNPALVDLATRFSTTDDLAAWFRTLPQRDDNGDPNDGPRVYACRPPQRLQLESGSPNCYERASRFIGAAELIEPDRVYRLATVSTPNGLHTFPTRDGEPVILDPKVTRNALRTRPESVSRYDGDIETRRLRLQRLIGTDANKGARADLANMRRAKVRGETTWVGGKPIELAIYNAERALAYHHAELAQLDESYPIGSDYDEDDGPGPGPFQTFAEFSAAYSIAHPMPPGSVRNAQNDEPEQRDALTLTPRQAIDWIAELAMTRAQRLIGGTRRIENGHRALCGVLVLRPICVADARDVALVLALAEREARKAGLGALKVVHSTARALDQVDQLAAASATGAPRNNPIATMLLGSLLENKNVQSWLGALSRVAGNVAINTGVEAAKVKLASVGLSPPVITAFEKELNKEGLSLGPLAKPPPFAGSLDAMTPQALAGRWLAQKF